MAAAVGHVLIKLKPELTEEFEEVVRRYVREEIARAALSAYWELDRFHNGEEAMRALARAAGADL